VKKRWRKGPLGLGMVQKIEVWFTIQWDCENVGYIYLTGESGLIGVMKVKNECGGMGV
jgi:hypothetical protein